MQKENLIAISEFCIHHNIEASFINSLHESGLVEIIKIEQEIFIYSDHLPQIEKMVRLYYDMGINLEGIETITYLMQKISDMQAHIHTLKNKLCLYSDE